MAKKLLTAVLLSASVLAVAPSQAQETTPADAYAKAYEEATGQPFVPEVQAVRSRGLVTTDMWDIFVDAWEPYAGNNRLYPDQLHQSDVWALLGVPDAYAVNGSDMFVFDYEYLLVYYDDFGYSQVVLWLPNSPYQ
jgi:hypothetical protein